MTKDRTFDYTVSYLAYNKIKKMIVSAKSYEHARKIWQRKIDDMQAFTESGSTPFHILYICIMK